MAGCFFWQRTLFNMFASVLKVETRWYHILSFLYPVFLFPSLALLSCNPTSSLRLSLKFLWRVSRENHSRVSTHSPVTFAFSTVRPMKRYRLCPTWSQLLNTQTQMARLNHNLYWKLRNLTEMSKIKQVIKHKDFMVKFWRAHYASMSPWRTGDEGRATAQRPICQETGHDPKFFFWTLIFCIKLQKASRWELKVTKCSCLSECVPVSFCLCETVQ